MPNKEKKLPELAKNPNLTGLKVKLKTSPKHSYHDKAGPVAPPAGIHRPDSPALILTTGVGWYFSISRRGLLSALAGIIVVVMVTYYAWLTPHSNTVMDEEHHIPKDIPFELTTNDIIFEVGTGSYVSLKPRRELAEDATIKIVFDDPDIIETLESFTIERSSSRSIFIPIHSKDGVAGHCVMSFKSASKELKNLFKVQIRIKVVHNILFGYLSIVIGWMYFLCWAFTYYPQIYSNYKRGSVVGLSFDYLALNFTGHIGYCVFNAAMYWNSYVQKQYTKLHPKGELPVHINDIMFSIHAVCGMCVLIGQCFVLERGEQRISLPIGTLVGGLWVTIILGLFAALQEKILWLRYLYYLAYIKLATVPLKYTPQVHLNYVRKSTEGWSIHSVMFDCAGGLLSFLQMCIDAINNDDLDGTLGNPGKLGLALMAIVYDLIFLCQHYLLYGAPKRVARTTWVSEPEDEQVQEFSKKLEELKAAIPIKRVGSVQEL